MQIMIRIDLRVAQKELARLHEVLPQCVDTSEIQNKYISRARNSQKYCTRFQIFKIFGKIFRKDFKILG